MTTLEKELTHQQQLNKELREFLEWNIGRLIYHPNADEIVAAVEPHFSKLVEQSKYIDEILDEVGIVAIADLGSKKYGTHERISYSVADNEKDAQEQLETYSQAVYKEIRNALGIDYHWVLKVYPDYWGYSSNALVEARMVFECDLGMPDCCILKL
jgi:hypothetical protein